MFNKAIVWERMQTSELQRATTLPNEPLRESE